jgi:hypothetical protein
VSEWDDASANNRYLDGACGSDINLGFTNQYVIGPFKSGGSPLPDAYAGDSKGFAAYLWSS